MTKSSTFWIAVAFVLYPPMLVMGLLIAIMPPLNIVGIPVWFMLAAGLVGDLSNRIEECRTREELAARALAKRAGGLAGPADERLVKRALVRVPERV